MKEEQLKNIKEKYEDKMIFGHNIDGMALSFTDFSNMFHELETLKEPIKHDEIEEDDKWRCEKGAWCKFQYKLSNFNKQECTSIADADIKQDKGIECKHPKDKVVHYFGNYDKCLLCDEKIIH